MPKLNKSDREAAGRQFAFQKIFLADCSDEFLLQLNNCRPRLDLMRDLTAAELKEARAENFISTMACGLWMEREESRKPGSAYPTSTRDLLKMKEEGWFDDPKPAELRREIAARQKRSRQLVRAFLLREAERFK